MIKLWGNRYHDYGIYTDTDSLLYDPIFRFLKLSIRVFKLVILMSLPIIAARYIVI